MADKDGSVRASEPRNVSHRRTPSPSSLNVNVRSHEPNLQIRHHHHHAPHPGSPPSGRGGHAEELTSPVTPSKRSERIFPISSVVNPPQAPSFATGNNEPLKSNSSSGRWTATTPTPYIEHGNPFDGDKLYLNFNEELDRQRQNKENMASRYASSHDTSGAQNVGLLQHPVTMRFQHKETDEGHCVVTVELPRFESDL
jgi:hypothetical protein